MKYSDKSQTLINKAKDVKLIIFDVDGVLTDGSLYFDNQGQEFKAFNSKDGHGLRLLLENDVEVAIITGRQSELVKHRATNLGLNPDLIYQGYRDKIPAFIDLLEKTGFKRENIAYVGDDVIDLPIMSQVGFSIAVGDANWFVKEQADWTTDLNGGKGAAREVSEFILDANGKLKSLYEAYTTGNEIS
ncbi:MAG: 3-deoxy-manno-octulosonate-8-phosphatase KdsC [Thiotrichaceae bacterium]|nr:3-deoxy-manno-octulosonate-8-phosphatase KdsC [Thiotrichaceae bacterium]